MKGGSFFASVVNFLFLQVEFNQGQSFDGGGNL